MSRNVHVAVVAPLPAARPLVSVIIPTRNRAHLLHRSINSVLAQTYAEFELIVVDDASTDATGELLASIHDTRLKVLHRERNAGAAAARNAALALARGELIAFHDDDDIWLPHKLEKQVAALLAAAPDTALCLCGRVFMETSSRLSYVGGAQMIGALDYGKGGGYHGPNYSLIATPGWLLRRSALDKVGGFDERIRSWDDWELGLRLWLEYDFIVVDEPLYVQDHVAGGGLMRMERARADDIEIIDQKHGHLWAHDRRIRARHAYTRGYALAIFDPRPAGRVELWQSLRLNPLAGKTWAVLLLSYLPGASGADLTQALRSLKGRLSHMIHG